MTDPDLARAFDFVLRADMAGTRVEPFRWGRAVLMPECPLRQDSNYLLVDPVPAVDKSPDQRIGTFGAHNRQVYVQPFAPEGIRARVPPGGFP